MSSKFLQRVAKKEGFRFVETLTGFKWSLSRRYSLEALSCALRMGSKSAELRAEGYEVIFAFEEAIGFCVGAA